MRRVTKASLIRLSLILFNWLLDSRITCKERDTREIDKQKRDTFDQKVHAQVEKEIDDLLLGGGEKISSIYALTLEHEDFHKELPKKEVCI